MLFTHSQSYIINKPIDQVYNLVADVQNYPNFIPLIKQVKILNSYDNTIEYSLTLGFKNFHETFSTKDVFYKPNKIEIFLIDGPMKSLYNLWEFTSIDSQTTKISFYISFEFKSKILGFAFGNIFTLAQKTIFNYFIQQAKKL
jgi:ribosome-associated toxin RatA of RatAB toxin-antitoxin module